MPLSITRFLHEHETGSDQKTLFRKLTDATIRKRCQAMLGDRPGCVQVFQDMKLTHSLVRQNAGDTPHFEDLAALEKAS